ncbi:MAG: hypothetical protein N2110_00120 [Flavobacteriales bacterium]|nr:hypothetical protein [Flavobacteriales bacterium]
MCRPTCAYFYRARKRMNTKPKPCTWSSALTLKVSHLCVTNTFSWTASAVAQVFNRLGFLGVL